MKKFDTSPEKPEVYRQMLLDRRRDIVENLGSKFNTRAALGRIAEDDQAQLSHDEFVSLRINSLDYAQLRLVDEALDRLTAGDYGICLACEQPIAPKRLRAVSWARYCVSCQDTVGRQLDREMAQV